MLKKRKVLGCILWDSEPKTLIQFCQSFQVNINRDFGQSFPLPEVKRVAVFPKINLKLKFPGPLSLDLYG